MLHLVQILGQWYAFLYSQPHYLLRWFHTTVRYISCALLTHWAAYTVYREELFCIGRRPHYFGHVPSDPFNRSCSAQYSTNNHTFLVRCSSVSSSIFQDCRHTAIYDGILGLGLSKGRHNSQNRNIQRIS